MHKLVSNYFKELPNMQLAQLESLDAEFRVWNEKLNLVSRKDLENLEERHVLHSMAIHYFNPFSPGTKVVDIGTGGGFPGLVLAILNPGAEFTLIDSIGKKVRAVEAISKSINLDNVTAIQTRSEDYKGSFQFIVGRAVTTLGEFWGNTRHLLARNQKQDGSGNPRPNGVLYLKGGDIAEELSHPLLAGLHVEQYKLNTVFKEPFFETKGLVYLSPNR